MPGTTRYSATFDRPYEEEDRIDPPPPTNARRSRSQSWQANSGLDGRPYTPFGSRPPTQQRSSSTDNGPPKGPEHIPTRTARTTVKAHSNPFQFVKVGTCPLYKKAEEQLKKAKEVKKPDVLKEEEEEWQSNLDSWKSRRRKMSEEVFRRQEEIKQLELEEQIAQVSQKKTKTFSEMVESRATRGRALSLCLISSPLEFQDWEYENKTHKNGSISYTDESEENSTVNSEDEGVSIRGRLGKASQSDSEINHRTNGDAHIEQNGSKLETQNGDYKKLSGLSSNNVQMKPKENSYIDSGLESISSSHRAGDTPDSGSDFSPDSNSSIDCDSPRTGVNILEEFTSKTSQITQGRKITVKLTLNEKGQDFGFTFLGGKDEGQVYIASVLEGSKAESSGIHLGDQINTIDGNDVSSKKHIEIVAMVQKAREKGEISLLLSRLDKSSESTNGFKTDEKHCVKPNKSESEVAKSYEKSIESENEMYVDDFEELQKQSELLASNNKSEKTFTNAQEQTNGNKSPSTNKDVSLKTSLENSSAPKLKDNISNGAVEKPNNTEQKTSSELNSENQKKNVVKVKRVRRKGVYALNVTSDPNQIPRGGISANSLFPLSPVTELPSPAEETKTISSTLSSNNTTAVSDSQKEIVPKEKTKETDVKINSPTIKENGKTSTVTLKTGLVSSSELKSNSSEKVEKETESVTAPSSPTKIKDKGISLESAQNEKPKTVSAPKKVKVKVKKATPSENATSATSQNTKEGTTNSVADTTAKTVTKENLKQSSNSQIGDTQEKITNGVQNVVSSQVKVTSETATSSTSQNTKGASNPFTSAIAKTVTKENSKLPNNSQISETHEKITNGVQNVVSSQVKGTASETITSQNTKGATNPVTNVTSKTVTKENSKLSSNSQIGETQGKITNGVQNVVSSQIKGTASENTTSATSQNTKGATNPVMNTSAKTVTKENSKLSSNSQVSETQGKITNGVQNVVSSQVKGTASENATSTTSQNTKVRTNRVTDAIAKIVTKENSKQSNNSRIGDTQEKITNGIQNTVSSRIKGITSENSTSAISQKTKVGAINPVIDASAKPITKENSKQSSNSQIGDTPAKITNGIQNAVSSQVKENGAISSGTTAITPANEAVTSQNKTPATTSSNVGNLSPKISTQCGDANNSSSVVVSNKQSKITTATEEDKSKPPAVIQKKIKIKPKANAAEPTPSESSQETKDSPLSLVSNTSDSSSKNLTKESQPKKEQKLASPSQDKQAKIVAKNESPVPSQTRENGVPSTGIATVLPNAKSSTTKDKNPNVSTSSEKTRNLTLKIDVKTEPTKAPPSSPVSNKPPKTPPRTPQGEKSKPIFVQKKEIAKPKVNSTISKHGCDLM